MNARTVIAMVRAPVSHPRICPMVRLAARHRNACRANASTASVATPRVPAFASRARRRSKVRGRTVSAVRSSTTSIPKQNVSMAPAMESAPANTTTALHVCRDHNACRAIASTASAATTIAADSVMPAPRQRKAKDPTACVRSSRATPTPTMNAILVPAMDRAYAAFPRAPRAPSVE